MDLGIGIVLVLGGTVALTLFHVLGLRRAWCQGYSAGLTDGEKASNYAQGHADGLALGLARGQHESQRAIERLQAATSAAYDNGYMAARDEQARLNVGSC